MAIVNILTNDAFSLDIMPDGLYRLTREESKWLSKDYMYIQKEEVPPLLEILQCMVKLSNATTAPVLSKSTSSPQEKIDVLDTDKTCV